MSCSPAVGAVPLRRQRQRGHRHRRQGGCRVSAGARPSGWQDKTAHAARPPERPVAVGDRSSLSVKCAPVPCRPLVRVGSQQYLCRIGKNPTEECQQTAQTTHVLRAGVSCVVGRKAPNIVSFFGVRPLWELWDCALCGSAPSFPVRRRAMRTEMFGPWEPPWDLFRAGRLRHNSGLDGQHNNTAYRDATVHVHQLRPEGQELRPIGTVPAPHWRTRSCLHYLKVFLAALFCRVLIKGTNPA